MDRIVFDVETGNSERRPLTVEEQAQYVADQVPPPPVLADPAMVAAAAVVAAKQDPSQKDPTDSALLVALSTLVAAVPEVAATIEAIGPSVT